MLLEVSTSGYYAWRERPLSATAARRAEIAVLAASAHAASDGTNGYRRVHRDLLADGVVCSWQLVRRVMREGDLAGAQPAAYRVTTRQDPDAQAAPDLINRDFTSQEPGTRLCGDITYIRTWAGWAYLAVVIDFSTKMIVGWQISNRASAQLCVEALEMAHRNGHVHADAIFHSDRGCQYTAGRSTAPPAASECASRWDEPASAGTTPKPKRSSPHSKSSASTAPRSRPSTTPAAPSAATSKCSTTAAADTQPSTTRPPTSDTHSSPSQQAQAA
jgi:hypothetical protein